jgi:hypothetical protein
MKLEVESPVVTRVAYGLVLIILLHPQLGSCSLRVLPVFPVKPVYFVMACAVCHYRQGYDHVHVSHVSPRLDMRRDQASIAVSSSSFKPCVELRER